MTFAERQAIAETAANCVRLMAEMEALTRRVTDLEAAATEPTIQAAAIDPAHERSMGVRRRG